MRQHRDGTRDADEEHELKMVSCVVPPLYGNCTCMRVLTCQPHSVGAEDEGHQVEQADDDCAYRDSDVARSVGIGQRLGVDGALHLSGENEEADGDGTGLGGTTVAEQ